MIKFIYGVDIPIGQTIVIHYIDITDVYYAELIEVICCPIIKVYNTLNPSNRPRAGLI